MPHFTYEQWFDVGTLAINCLLWGWNLGFYFGNRKALRRWFDLTDQEFAQQMAAMISEDRRRAEICGCGQKIYIS
jgi:hypothetical protein